MDRKERRHSKEGNILQGIRVKFSSFGGHSTQSASSGAESKAKKAFGGRSSTHSSFDDSSFDASHEGQESSTGSPVPSARSPSIFRHATSNMSASSLGSDGGDGAVAFNEEDEVDEDLQEQEEGEKAAVLGTDTERRTNCTSTDVKNTSSLTESTDFSDPKEVTKGRAGGSAGEMDPSCSPGPASEPGAGGSPKKSKSSSKNAKKRRKKSKDKDSSKCVIQ